MLGRLLNRPGTRSGWSSETADEHSDVCFAELARCHSQHHLGEIIFGSIEDKSVQVEKDERSHSTDASVAIDEGMVLDQVEKISGCHLVHVRVQEPAAIGSRWNTESGLEQFHISNACGAAVTGNLVLVNFQYLTQGPLTLSECVQISEFYDRRARERPRPVDFEARLGHNVAPYWRKGKMNYERENKIHR